MAAGRAQVHSEGPDISYSQKYVATTVDQLWEYASLQPEDRVRRFPSRTKCACPECDNTMRPHYSTTPTPEQTEEMTKTKPHLDWTEGETDIWKEEEAGLNAEDTKAWVLDEGAPQYQINTETKEIRRVSDKMVVKRTSTKRKIMIKKPTIRAPGRLVCVRCRDIIYCSIKCAQLDHGRHRIECDNESSDILKRVILEDDAGVQYLVDKDPLVAFKHFGGHSIWSFAELIGNQYILATLRAAIEARYFVYACPAVGDPDKFAAIINMGFWDDVQKLPINTPKSIKAMATKALEDHGKRQFKREAQRQFWEVSQVTAEMEELDLGKYQLDVDDVEQAIVSNDTERFEMILSRRPDVVDFDVAIQFANENKYEFMAGWISARKANGVEKPLESTLKGQDTVVSSNRLTEEERKETLPALRDSREGTERKTEHNKPSPGLSLDPEKGTDNKAGLGLEADEGSDTSEDLEQDDGELDELDDFHIQPLDPQQTPANHEAKTQ